VNKLIPAIHFPMQLHLHSNPENLAVQHDRRQPRSSCYGISADSVASCSLRADHGRLTLANETRAPLRFGVFGR
jgi:hypothetical protein